MVLPAVSTPKMTKLVMKNEEAILTASLPYLDGPCAASGRLLYSSSGVHASIQLAQRHACSLESPNAWEAMEAAKGTGICGNTLGSFELYNEDTDLA